MSKDYGLTEYVAQVVLMGLVFLVLAVAVTALVVRYAYRVDGIEDSQCRSGVLHILTDDGDGERTWKSTEARCEVTK